MTLQENKLYLYMAVIALMSWWLAELTGVIEIIMNRRLHIARIIQ